MKNRWSDADARKMCGELSAWGDDTALRVYSSRLLGEEPDLVMHGGGNTSVKSWFVNALGDRLFTLVVKASGVDMRTIGADGFVALDLGYLVRLSALESMTDEDMAQEFETHRLRPPSARASIEALMHAVVPGTFVDHTHPAAICALTNRDEAEEVVREALGENVAVIPYVRSGFELARAVERTLKSDARLPRGLVISRHGLVTWGGTAQAAYEATIEIVTKAEEYLARSVRKRIDPVASDAVAEARRRYTACAPVLRGALSPATGDPGNPFSRTILAPLIDKETLGMVESEGGRAILDTSPVTPDYLIRTRARPLVIAGPDYANLDNLRKQVSGAAERYARQYGAYLKQAGRGGDGVSDLLPRCVFLPGIGGVCAGRDAAEAAMVRDITSQSVRVKRAIHETGGVYAGISEEHLLDMECRSFQRTKLGKAPLGSLRGSVAVVSGSAGAIGSGICEMLLSEGCHVAATDLPGPPLDSMLDDLSGRYGGRVIAPAMDVTDAESVRAAFDTVIGQWGGVDILVINAGLAHVASLADLELDDFRRLEKVNVEGTFLCLRHAARHFAVQRTEGDIVVVSTKNVFAPGAQFGAYSATKAASHQLARIASLELAALGVRVNMVSPDAVFSHGSRKSGLWATVGPGRMKARGLDEKGLEEYYRNRNLLKAGVTSEHVARAVLFFVTRQTPTTGATIPVDGGLPDSTPR